MCERTLGRGCGRFGSSFGRSRIWSAEELGVDGRPGLLGVSLNGVLGKRSVHEPGTLLGYGVARVLTPWQGMMRSKSHPATVLASFVIALMKAEIRNQSVNEKECEIAYVLSLLSPQMKFLWNSV